MTKNTILLLLGILALSCSMNPKMDQPAADVTFTYETDAFSDSALLDLRDLNETYAGEHGFIQLSDDGESFIRQDGEPIRFWAVNNGGASRGMSDEELAQHARFLAKIGVNMVRYHGSINPPGQGTRITDVDTTEIRNIWRYVAAMKKEGIYSTISPFWAHNGHMGGWVPEEWGIEGYSGKDALWGVMYFNDKLQEAYKTWVRELYTQTNPYTGIPLKDDPAVAIIQIKNEDGVFFWTMQNMKPELEEMISRQFHSWVTEKHGSIEKAYESWNGLQLPKDDINHLELLKTWHMTIDLPTDSALRMSSQVEFYAQKQYDFYKEIYNFYRDELGCPQLINANNWKTADNERLNDLERYTYMACDVAAVNRYYSPGHLGEFSGWRIDPGHFYTGESVMTHPDKLPINIKQTKGMPMLMTESGWNLPQKYQAEGPFLIAAYQSLTGVDGYYWFSITDQDYDDDPYHNFIEFDEGQHPMHRWTASAPWGIGMFPANALIYRKGLIKEAPTVVDEKRSFESLWNREKPIISEDAGFDPNRDRENMVQDAGVETELSPLVYLTGKVEWEPVKDSSATAVSDELAEWINFQNKTVRSATGELEWDYDKGWVKMNALQAQGIGGFVPQDDFIKMDDIEVKTTNNYIVLQVVAMDDKPIGESGSILIQAGTVWRPENWQEHPDTLVNENDTLPGYRIENTGNMPWNSEEIKAMVKIKNPLLQHAYKLNSSGYIEEEIPLTKRSNQVTLQFPEDAIYVVLTE